jgi:hypothetical protein
MGGSRRGTVIPGQALRGFVGLASEAALYGDDPDPRKSAFIRGSLVFCSRPLAVGLCGFCLGRGAVEAA